MRRQLHTLCAALDANRWTRNSQREHFGWSAKCRKLVASPSKSAKLRGAGTYGGKKNVQQVYAIHFGREGAWHRDGDAVLQLSPRQPGGDRSRRKPDRDAVPAP